MLQEQDALLHSLKDNLHNAQHRMQQRANLLRRKLELAVGDTVMVHLQPYHKTSVANRGFNKLAKRYYGPFSIIELVGSVVYRFILPSKSKIQPVFHFSMLKPFHGTSIPTPCLLPQASMDNWHLSLLAAIFDVRTLLHHDRETHQILVQWQGSPPENATWEFFDEFCKLYPHYHLKDKVFSKGVGSDTTQSILLNIPSTKLMEEQPNTSMDPSEPDDDKSP